MHKNIPKYSTTATIQLQKFLNFKNCSQEWLQSTSRVRKNCSSFENYVELCSMVVDTNGYTTF